MKYTAVFGQCRTLNQDLPGKWSEDAWVGDPAEADQGNYSLLVLSGP